MTDKIINGIDVSECGYINCCSKKAKCIILQDDILSDSQYCESEPNCYFKQLKRLQEENKEKINILEQIINILYLNANDDELYDVTFNGEYINKLKKVIQALEKIRDIVSDEIDKTDADDELMQIYGTIYNRCNEALNDRN